MAHPKHPHSGRTASKPPVSLEDTGGEDTALPMPAEMGESARKPNRSDTSAGGSSGDTRGKSTGLETMLGKVFIDRGYVTPDELDACRAIQEARTTEDNPAELTDILIENDYVTRKQVSRVRVEVEAEKSTQQIPGYKIIKKLGSGAMATVFLARQLSLDRLVAVKVLPSKFSANEKFIERFYKEGRAAAQLNHRNIVAAYDVGNAGEHHYFVMEYVDGDSVYDRIKKSKRIDEDDAIDIIHQTAAALEHAHAKGFVHRDVKPKNIMITTEGAVKLADLGLARAVSDKEAAEAEAGRAYGTPYYISPEQIRGELKIDGRADIYGLGATFYHLVTGKVPFQGKNPSAVMHKHLKQTLVPPDHVNARLRPGTAQVIEMMMSKSRRKRYQNVTDLMVDLDLIANGEQPHFAHSFGDFTGLSKIEDAAKAPIVETVLAQDVKRSRIPMENPWFLIAIGLVVVSLLINLVLIAVLTSTNAPQPNSGLRSGGNTQNSGSAPVGTTLLGAWETTELSGPTFTGVRDVQLALYASGAGSLVRWFDSSNQPDAQTFTWSSTDNVIRLRFTGGSSQYTYKLEKGTLLMSREGSSDWMKLQRQ